MPIKNLEGRLTEIGRLRLGHRQQVTDNGKPRMKDGKPVFRPARGETWRLTSDDPDLLKLVAAEYGGDVKPWDNAPDDTDRWELFTTRSDLRVIIPAGHALSQWMEYWRRNLCVRRCDGQQMYRGVLPTGLPCECAEEFDDPDKFPCQPTTRLSVMLLDVPAAGVWRCELHGWYGAAELLGVAQLLTVAGLDGRIVPATLLIQQRSLPARPGRPARRIVLPVLRPDHGFLRQVALEGASPTRALQGRRGELEPPSKGSVDVETGEYYGEIEQDGSDRLGGEPPPAQPAGPNVPTLQQIERLCSVRAAKELIQGSPQEFQALIPRAIADVHGNDPHQFWDHAKDAALWQQALEYALELHEQHQHETAAAGVSNPPAGPAAAPNGTGPGGPAEGEATGEPGNLGDRGDN